MLLFSPMNDDPRQHGGQPTYNDLSYDADCDDRVLCYGCPHQSERQAVENMLIDTADYLRRNGREPIKPGDTARVSGKWLHMTWAERYCTITDLPTMPHGTMHRCPYIKPKDHPSQKAQSQTKPPESQPAQPAQPAQNWWD